MFDSPPPNYGNIGEYLTDVSEALIRDDNRKHQISLAKDLNGGCMTNVCKEEV